MKRFVFVALSLSALLFSAVRSAQAADVLDFAPPSHGNLAMADSEPRELPFTQDSTKSRGGAEGETPDRPLIKPLKTRASQPIANLPKVTPIRKSTQRKGSKPFVSATGAVSFQPSRDADVDDDTLLLVPSLPPNSLASQRALTTSSVSSAPSSALFEGGSNSLVATAVGSAEGTRTPDGGKTWAYYGHVDPGNARWNLGSFSYQHEARSPEDADERQLNRLRRQFEVIRQTASTNGLQLSLEEQLNAIDLANQAPLAALAQGGYVERLQQARDRGLRGTEAVLQARTYSFINPNTNQWDAPGLGNTEYSISRDQARRLSAIAQAMAMHPSTRAIESVAERGKNDPSSSSDSTVSSLPADQSLAPLK
jgi:hypothetical protein